MDNNKNNDIENKQANITPKRPKKPRIKKNNTIEEKTNVIQEIQEKELHEEAIQQDNLVNDDKDKINLSDVEEQEEVKGLVTQLSSFFGIVFIFIVILGVISGIIIISGFINDNNNVKFLDKTTEKITKTSEKNTSTTTSKINYDYTEDISYSTNGKKSLVNSYVCNNDNCNIFNLSSNGKYVVIYDNNKYFLYDIVNKKEYKELNLYKRNYSSINVYTLDDNRIGLVLSTATGHQFGYFDVILNKQVINFGEYDLISTNDRLINDGFMFVYIYSDSKIELYDLNEGKVSNLNISHIIKDSNSEYYYFDDSGNSGSITKIYDKNLNIIYDGSVIDTKNVYIKDNILIFYSNTSYYIYDDNVLIKNKVNSTKVYGVSDKYLLVSDNDNIYYVDFNGNIAFTITGINNEIDSTDFNSTNSFSYNSKYSCSNITSEDEFNEFISDTKINLDYDTFTSYCKNSDFKVVIRVSYDENINDIIYSLVS